MSWKASSCSQPLIACLLVHLPGVWSLAPLCFLILWHCQIRPVLQRWLVHLAVVWILLVNAFACERVRASGMCRWRKCHLQ